jgi:acyl carrier protein
MNDIQRELLQFVAQECLNGNGSGLELDTPLLELRILDSLTVASLYTFVEIRYGVILDNGVTSPKDLATIRLLANLIESRRPSS